MSCMLKLFGRNALLMLCKSLGLRLFPAGDLSGKLWYGWQNKTINGHCRKQAGLLILIQQSRKFYS
jgi:hypothetical protein